MRLLAAVLSALCVGLALPAQSSTRQRGVTAEDYFAFTFAAEAITILLVTEDFTGGA